MIKLGLDVRTMSPGGTGIGRAKIEIVKKLIAKLPPDKWEIHLFPGFDTKTDFELPGNVIYHEELKDKNSTAWRSVRYCPAAAKKSKIDIFHSLDFLGPVWKSGFKLVQTVHDIIPALFPASLKSRFMCNYIMPFMFKADDVIIASSENTKKDLLKKYTMPPEKIKVIPLAGRDEFRQDVPEADISRVKSKYGISNPYFLFTGTLEPKKNVVRIGKAFLKTNTKFKNFNMVFAGKKGWDVDELYEISKDNPSFIFAGFVPDEDIIPLVKGAFAFVFPSIYEGFGLPVLDAYNAGVPLITSTAASIPEIAGSAALSVNPESVDDIAASMIDLIENPFLRQELIKKGYTQAKQFTWDKTADRIINIYNSLI